MRRHRELEDHRARQLELSAAIVAHTVAYFSPTIKDDSRKKLTYGDFMPSERSKKKKLDPRLEAVSSLRAFFTARREAAEQTQRRITGKQLG